MLPLSNRLATTCQSLMLPSPTVILPCTSTDSRNREQRRRHHSRRHAGACSHKATNNRAECLPKAHGLALRSRQKNNRVLRDLLIDLHVPLVILLRVDPRFDSLRRDPFPEAASASQPV